METDCKPVGKRSNYDVLGSKVRAVLRPGPLGHQILQHTSLRHTANYIACQWVIYCTQHRSCLTIGNEWAMAVHVLRLGPHFDTYRGVFSGATACKRFKCTQEYVHKHAGMITVSSLGCAPWHRQGGKIWVEWDFDATGLVTHIHACTLNHVGRHLFWLNMPTGFRNVGRSVTLRYVAYRLNSPTSIYKYQCVVQTSGGVLTKVTQNTTAWCRANRQHMHLFSSLCKIHPIPSSWLVCRLVSRMPVWKNAAIHQTSPLDWNKGVTLVKEEPIESQPRHTNPFSLWQHSAPELLEETLKGVN